MSLIGVLIASSIGGSNNSGAPATSAAPTTSVRPNVVAPSAPSVGAPSVDASVAAGATTVASATALAPTTPTDPAPSDVTTVAGLTTPTTVANLTTLATVAGLTTPATVANLTTVATLATPPTAVTPGPTATTNPKAVLVGRGLDWAPCGAFDCAVMKSPLDYAAPDGSKVEIGVIRRPAGDGSRRIGSLVINPGGPGNSALDTVQEVEKLLPAEVLATFDIIGVEPRAVGATELPCQFASIVATIPDGTIAEVFRAYRAACAKRAGNLAAHVDTVSSARDIDRVRDAMGEDKISFVGLSWGSYLGAVYAQLFPSHIRAFLADSPEDLATVGAQRLQERVAAWESTLRAFGDACASEPVKSCPLNDGVDPLVHLEQIASALAKLPDADTGTTLRLRFERTILDGLSVGSGAVLAGSLSALARTPDAATLKLFEGTVSQLRQSRSQIAAPSIAPNEVTSALFAVGCIDAKLPSGPVTLSAPHFVEYAAFLGATLNCSGWPVRAVTRPLGGSFAGPALVIGTTFDIETPYPWSQRLTAELGAHLLTRVGLGHVSLGRSNACINDAVVSFLRDLTLPPATLTC